MIPVIFNPFVCFAIVFVTNLISNAWYDEVPPNPFGRAALTALFVTGVAMAARSFFV